MTTTFQAASDGGGHIEWLLEVAGIGVRYYSGPVPPPSKDVPGLIATPYVDVPAITNVGNWSEGVEPSRAWYEGGSVSVELGTRGLLTGNNHDAGYVFSPVGRVSADHYAQVVTEINGTSVSFDLDRAWTGGSSGVMHVDRETFTYLYPGGGPPYTVTIVGRGRMGSWEQVHLTDAWTGLLPEATDSVVNWLGRPAYLYYSVRYDGAPVLSEPSLWSACIMTSSPQISGAVVNLTVSPVTAMLDKTLGGVLQTPRRAQLVTGVHRFYAGAPSVWACAQSLSASAARTMSHGAGGVNTVALAGVDYTNVHSLLFGAAQGWMATAAPIHPRWGHLDVQDNNYTGPAFIVASGAPPTLSSPGMVALAGGASTNRAASELVAVELVPAGSASQDYIWPSGLSAAIQSRFTGSAVATASGTWLNIVFAGDGNSYLALPNYLNSTDGTPLDDPCKVAFLWTEEFPEGGIGMPHGSLWQDVLGVIARPGRWEDQSFYQAPPTISEQTTYAIRPDVEPSSTKISQRGQLQTKAHMATLDVNTNQVRMPVRVALGWREVGEPSVFVETDPGIPPNGCTVLIEWSELDGSEKTAEARASGPATVDTVSGVTCYRVDLDSPWRIPSFGSWPGQPSCTITPMIAWNGIPSSRILLELLESSGGGTLGTYDVQPWGAGIPDTYIDEESFLSFQDTPGVNGWNIQLLPDSDISEVLSSILLVTNTQLIIRRGAGGTSLLTRVAAGIPALTGPRAFISHSDILSYPDVGLDDYIVSQYVIKTGDEDELTYVDQRSVATHGEGQTLELDLRGIRVGSGSEPVVRALGPVIGTLAATFGSSRRMWTFTVPIRIGITLYPGVDVSVTSAVLYGHGRTPGVSGAVAKVQSVDHDLLAGTSTLTLVYYGLKTTAYNASMRGVGIPAANQLTVEDNYYTNGVDPVLGQDLDDVDDFAVGDSVWIYTEGDPDGGVTRAILAITGPIANQYTVTFTAVHGLTSTPAIVEKLGYDATGTNNLAYLADSNGTLGAAGDSGMVYG